MRYRFSNGIDWLIDVLALQQRKIDHRFDEVFANLDDRDRRCCLPGRACGQLRLSRRSVVEGKMIMEMMEWGGHRGQCTRFPGICLTTEENPGKPQLGIRLGHLVA